MICSYLIKEPDNKELECRRIIMQSIDSALKKGDEVFEKLIRKEKELIPNTTTFSKFKDSLKNIHYENLKK